MDLGFFRLAVDTVFGIEQSRNASDVPTAADSTPTYQVLDGDGNILHSGNCATFGAYTGAYKFSFTTDNTFQRGQPYLVRVAYTVGSAARASYYIFKVT